MKRFSASYSLQSTAQSRQFKLFLQHFLLGLTNQQVSWFVLVEHLPQQGSTDLQLTGALALSWKSLNQQTSNLGNTSKAAPTQFREIQGLFQIGFQIAVIEQILKVLLDQVCLLYTSPSPRD